MAYQYPTYQQALPDTTLYERLQGSYTPIQGRPNPYANFEQGGMLSQDALDYQADPLGYVKKKFGSLDKVLKKDAPDVGLGGLFGSQPSQASEGGGDGIGGRNYYQELEDRLTELNISEDGMDPEDARAAAIKSAFAIQSANNQKINDAFTDFSKIGIAGLFSKIIGGSPLDQRPPNVAMDSDAIARAQQQREADIRAQQIAAQQAAEQAARDAARNVQPVSTYTPSGNASDWSPVDSNNNISWGGQTYSRDAYEGLMP
jgi:hypothetical protein